MSTVTARIVDEDDLVKDMVGRFLTWRLPENFAPDCGVAFTPPPEGVSGNTWPVGTNLLDAQQAEAMVKHLLGLERS